MSKNKLLPATSKKLQAKNGVQILPGPITSEERVVGSPELYMILKTEILK